MTSRRTGMPSARPQRRSAPSRRIRLGRGQSLDLEGLLERSFTPEFRALCTPALRVDAVRALALTAFGHSRALVVIDGCLACAWEPPAIGWVPA